MQLNTAQKCTKGIRLAKESNSSATVFSQITKCYKDSHADLAYSQTDMTSPANLRLPIRIHGSSKQEAHHKVGLGETRAS